MRTLYLECDMGAAGDMLTAALLSLLPEPKVFLDRMNALGLDGVSVSAETVSQLGISGMQMRIMVNGAEEESHDVHEHGDCEHHHASHHEHDHCGHDHTHHHEDRHGHSHASIQDVLSIIQMLDISDIVKRHACAVYQLLAEAECHAHGVPVSEIHFHEVGTMDAIADIVGVCLLLEMLQPERIVVSPISVGSGSVRCAHGILPVPAPATAYILRGVPIRRGSVEGELCTPTGAALLKYFADEFGEMPLLQTEQIGYGFGKKSFDRLNCVRVFLGETPAKSMQIAELICNVDDMTGEELGFAQEVLRNAGAREVFTVPVMMKKNRPGVMLVCLCVAEQEAEMIRLIFRHTSTIGIRKHLCERYTLEYQIDQRNTEYGKIRTKIASGFGVIKTKTEYEDIAEIARAHDLTLRELREKINTEA